MLTWRAARAWRLELRDALASLRLTPSQFIVLDAVGRLAPYGPEGTTQQMIVDDLGMDRTTVSQVMQQLDSRGLVDREAGEYLSWCVLLTGEGRSLLERALPIVQSATKACFGGLAAEQAFIKALRRVGDSREGDTKPRKH